MSGNVTGIVLVTGLPGHGKTLYTLQWVEGERKASESTAAPRQVFHNSIPGLALADWKACKPEDWRTLPPGSIFVIDECQDAFPTRGRGEPPEWIAELAKHRHLGLAFVIITQNPMLIDSFVRRLIDRHFHVIRKFGTQFATVHEFANGARDNVAVSRQGSIRHEWRYPASVFAWYKSAEVHTVKRRIPMRVWIMLGVPVVFLAVAWFAWTRLNPAAQGARAVALGQQAGVPAPGPGGRGAAPRSRADYLADYSPRVRGLAFTAPVYDKVTEPSDAPFPAACVQSASKGCKCYSQQGTALDMDPGQCAGIVGGGFFLAWRPQLQGGDRRPPPVDRQPEPSAGSGLIAIRAGGLGMVPDTGGYHGELQPDSGGGRKRAPAAPPKSP